MVAVRGLVRVYASRRMCVIVTPLVGAVMSQVKLQLSTLLDCRRLIAQFSADQFHKL